MNNDNRLIAVLDIRRIIQGLPKSTTLIIAPDINAIQGTHTFSVTIYSAGRYVPFNRAWMQKNRYLAYLAPSCERQYYADNISAACTSYLFYTFYRKASQRRVSSPVDFLPRSISLKKKKKIWQVPPIIFVPIAADMYIREKRDVKTRVKKIRRVSIYGACAKFF